MKYTFLLSGLLSLALVGAVKAASTLQISKPIAGNIASGFANAAGTPTNGMYWGIVVDTGNNGFSGSGGSYDSMALGAQSNAAMSFGGGASDDYFVYGGSTSDSTGVPEAGFVTSGGAGTITNIAVTYNNGIASGQSFALIWFASNSSAEGDKYGFFTDASLTMPADGQAAVPRDSAFAGNDAPRTASNTFGGALAPEPSRMMLALFGIGLVGLRRRR